MKTRPKGKAHVEIEPLSEMRWHPYAETFPMIEGPAWDDFLADIKKAGGNDDPIKYRMVRGRKEYLDGRNRARACKELGLECKEEEVYVPDDEVVEYIRRRNVIRRHLTVEERRAEVAKRRAGTGGESIRQIAEAVGVSPATVQRDIKAIECSESPTVPNGTVGKPEIATVFGKDGKLRAAHTRKLCDRCERVARPNGVKDCPACRDLNRKAPKKKKAAPKDEAPEEAPKDAFGNVIPKRCRDAYADPWIQETIDFLGVTVARFWQQRMADGMKKRMKHYPFFKGQDFIDGNGLAGNYIDQMLEHLKEFRPAGVCPACKGAGCGSCMMAGLVPREKYEELKAGKAAVEWLAPSTPTPAASSPLPETPAATSPLALPPDLYKCWQERTGIRQFDGGATREQAEALALADVLGQTAAPVRDAEGNEPAPETAKAEERAATVLPEFVPRRPRPVPVTPHCHRAPNC